MKITDVEAIVVANPRLDDALCDSAQDAVIIRVRTDEGVVGLGETNSTPLAVKAVVDAPGSHSWSLGIKELLIGEDPEQTERIWDKLYYGTRMSGRRGLVVNVIAAIDVALWDIRGKIAGKPVYQLLGGARREQIEAYVTIYPNPAPAYDRVVGHSLDLIDQARALGFRAFKQEALLDGVPDHRLVPDIVGRARRAVGPEARLMLDVGYRWHDVKTAQDSLARMAECDLFFVETPFSMDDVASYARLAAVSSVRLAAGEFGVTRFEFLDLMDRGSLDVVQPGVGRVGGFTEAMRVAQLAGDRGRLVVPYGWWATGIGLATSIHLGAAVEHCPYIEHAPASLYPSLMRDHLVRGEPIAQDGFFPLPTAPGLGVELDEDALQRFRIA